MLSLEKRIRAFSRLGELIREFLSFNTVDADRKAFETLFDAIRKAESENPWFTGDNIRMALSAIEMYLDEKKLRVWALEYSRREVERSTTKRVAVIMAGNIPLVGFHDLLCVIMSGNSILCKLSSCDRILLPAIAELLTAEEPELKDCILFSDEKLKDFDAVIATGSNNTARYFEYYFSSYPLIIRKNRTSIAVLSGGETTDELKALCTDIFSYFGLGCRNISKIFVPQSYDFTSLLDIASEYRHLTMHNKYFNNYEYYKSIFLINSIEFYDNQVMMLTREKSLYSPVSVLYYDYYEKKNELIDYLSQNSDKLQCIVSGIQDIPGTMPFGKAQFPELRDYADGIDTMKFLAEI